MDDTYDSQGDFTLSVCWENWLRKLFKKKKKINIQHSENESVSEIHVSWFARIRRNQRSDHFLKMNLQKSFLWDLNADIQQVPLS